MSRPATLHPILGPAPSASGPASGPAAGWASGWAAGCSAGPRLTGPARRPWHRRIGSALLLAAALLAGGCGSVGDTPRGLPCAAMGRAIEDAHPRARVAFVDWIGANGQGHPAHCLVQGALNERIGSDGQAYAIGFELRLPQPWNGRFLHQTHGGTDGVRWPAFGRLEVLPRDALARGFAVLSSDGGHVADRPALADWGLARGVAFGHEPQARADFAGAALDALWPVADTAVRARYGRPAQANYMAGCGHGGRLGLVAALRHPERYDGILAGAPALQWPQAALQHPWDWQHWREVSEDPRLAFTREQLAEVARRVVERCDALDLLADGQVLDIGRCQQSFRYESLQCPDPVPRGGAATGGLPPRTAPAAPSAPCLSGAQVQALRAVMGGPLDPQGRPLYTAWPIDPGIASAGWRRWRLRSDIAAWDRQPVAATVGAATLAHLFSTPPQPVAGSIEALEAFLLGFRFDTDARRIHAVDPASGQSAVSLMATGEAEAAPLAAFMRRGGRMLIYHGSADPAFSLEATLEWVERVQGHWGLVRADQNLRAFVVPGMGHCRGGPATDRFDALAALVDWVEQPGARPAGGHGGAGQPRSPAHLVGRAQPPAVPLAARRALRGRAARIGAELSLRDALIADRKQSLVGRQPRRPGHPAQVAAPAAEARAQNT